MTCGHCGAENLSGVFFCAACGREISPDRVAVVAYTEGVSLREARAHLARDLRAWLAGAILFFAAAIAFRASFTEATLPAFPDAPVAEIFPGLPVHDDELLPHPWLLLSPPE